MGLQFLGGQLLFENGQLAMDPDCCCDGVVGTPCVACNAPTGQVLPDTISVTLPTLQRQFLGCTLCDDLSNVTYILDKIDACGYSICFPEECNVGLATHINSVRLHVDFRPNEIYGDILMTNFTCQQPIITAEIHQFRVGRSSGSSCYGGFALTYFAGTGNPSVCQRPIGEAMSVTVTPP